MKVTTEVECALRAAAQLSDSGELSLKVFAEAEYAPGRTTTAEVAIAELPEPVQAKVRDALADAIAAATEGLGLRINRAIHKSAEVAAAHGEI